MIICSENKCTACCCCLNICPKKCISMIENEYGEMHPIIDENKCINCKVCVKNCPANNESEFHEIKKCYAACTLNNKDRKISGSGGVATAFSKIILDLDGAVFGAKYDNKLNIVHFKAEDMNDIEAFKGSKYAQSYIGNSYAKVKNILNSGKLVLFVGTPCQVDGLNFFLERKYDNLISIDLVCHGTPPVKYLKEYIDYLKVKATSVRFRGEDDYIFTVLNNENITFKNPKNSDLYLYGFSEGIFCRNNCYNCKYAQKSRVSDITIGDFWGLGVKTPFKHKINRPSEILINTNKGMLFFNKCKSSLFYEERNIEEAIMGNGQLQHPLELHNKTNKFRKFYKRYGFIIAVKKIRLPFYMKTRVIRLMIKRVIRPIIKKNKYLNIMFQRYKVKVKSMK